ncbi:MAG: GspH/FimT family pseudopilin [Candidatus Margulisiibacteriota bacterium]
MKGHTLIELIIIMVLLSILSITSFIALNSYRAQYLRAAAERLVSDLNYAKNYALSSTQWTGMAFQVTPNNTYSVYTTDGVADVTIKSPQDPGRDFAVSVPADYPGVEIDSVNIGGGSKVEFSPLGVPYPDKSSAALAATGTIVLSKSGSTITVDIAPETGRVYIP